MKRLILCAALSVALNGFAAPKIDRIEPEFWYAGMKNTSLQIMIHGDNIRDLKFSVEGNNVKVDSVAKTDSPNYIIAYLNVKNCVAGDFNIKVGKQTIKYQLKQREKSGDNRYGFSIEDVLYLLMPDRFSSGRTDNDQISGLEQYTCNREKPSLRHGGDLEGVIGKIDYFKQLGVTALWFTPVLENNSPDDGEYSTYHGYAVTNYYKIDPRFGSNDDYRRLTDIAHKNGIKVVMDMIFNHCGYEHPWVKDMPTSDWFNRPEWLKESKGRAVPNDKYLQTSYRLTPVRDPYASKIDISETVEGWFVPTMPDLNQRNPHVMRYLIQNSKWWIETIGIDGIRMDTYPYAFGDAMAKWMEEINLEYPNFNTVGETWVVDAPYTASWQKDNRLINDNSGLKTVMDFSFYDCITNAVTENTNNGFSGFNRVYNSFVYDFLYPNPESVLAFLENHDTDRFIKETDDSLSLKQALAILLTVKRIPQLYYGVEIMMKGVKDKSDGYVRTDFPGGFPGDRRNAFTREGRTQAENAMFDWLSTVLNWRKGNSVITKGDMVQFLPHNGFYAIARRYNGKTVFTIVNGTNSQASLSVERYAEILNGKSFGKDITTGKNVDLTSDIKFAPKQTMILEF